jgi:hypothetical protein
MDGGFDGPRTAEAARENGFDAHFTMLSGSKAMGSAADFQLDDENRSVLECPNKVVPEESHYLEKSQSVSVQMKTSACAKCPKRSECPGGKAFDRLAVDAAKKAQAAASSEAGKSDAAGSADASAEGRASADSSSGITLRLVVEDGRVYVNGVQLPELIRFPLKVSTVTRARRQRDPGTEEARAFGRRRNGVEATPSCMRRKIRIDRTPTARCTGQGFTRGADL